MSTTAGPDGHRRVVVDASVVLAWYLPAEPFKADALELLADATSGGATLHVPSLTRYEVVNVLALAVRGARPQRRLAPREAQEILTAFLAVPFEEHPIAGLEQRILEIARAFNRSACDAAYLALSEALHADYVTGDAALYRAVHHRFPRVVLAGT